MDEGTSKLDFLCEPGSEEISRLHNLVQDNQIEEVEEQLKTLSLEEKCKLLLAKDEFDQTALTMAAARGDNQLTNLILGSIPPIKVLEVMGGQDTSGNTALHYAAKRGDVKTIQIMAKFVPDGSLRPFLLKENVDGKTPQKLAESYEKWDAADMLTLLQQRQMNEDLSSMAGVDPVELHRGVSPSERMSSLREETFDLERRRSLLTAEKEQLAKNIHELKAQLQAMEMQIERRIGVSPSERMSSQQEQIFDLLTAENKQLAKNNQELKAELQAMKMQFDVCPDSEDPLPLLSMTSEPHHSHAYSKAETSLQKDTTALEDSSDVEAEVQRKEDNKLFLELGRGIKAQLSERELKEFSIFQNPYARTNVYVIGKDASSILGKRLESYLKATSRFDKFCVTLHEREGTITTSQLAGDQKWSEVLTMSCQADDTKPTKNHATSEVLVQPTAPPKSIYAVGPAHMLFTDLENYEYYSEECDIDEVRTNAQERSVDVRWRGRERDAEVTPLLGYRYAFRQMPESVHGLFTNDCVLLKLNDQQIAESMQEDLHTSIAFRTETLKTISSIKELQELQENEARISVRRYKGRLYNCGAFENERSKDKTVHLSFYLDNASVKLIPGHSGSIVYYVEEGKRSPLGMLIERERISADNSRFHYYKAVVLNQAFRDIETDNPEFGKIELYAGPAQLPPSEKALRNNFRHQ